MTGGQPIRMVAPTVLPVTVLEAKAHLNITHSDQDTLIDSYLRAAVARIEMYTGLGLLQQTWQQTFPAFASPMLLYRRPLLAIGTPPAAVQVTFLDSSGATQTLDDGVYRVTGIGADRAYGAVRLGDGQVWPTTQTDDEAVTITYTVGYGTDPDDVPEVIRHAIKIVVADWYGYRESIVQGGNISDLPFGALELLREWRPLAVA